MSRNLNSTNALFVGLFVILSLFRQSQSADFDIMKYGAKADGQSDISQALLSAWKEACAAIEPSKVIVPAGKYAVGQVTFEGPCKAPVTFVHQGTFMAPSDPSKLKGDFWIDFRTIDLFTMKGGGTFDGQGNIAWTKNECTKSRSCSVLPTNVRLDFLTNSIIDGVTSLNSKMFHYNVLGCKNLTLNKMTITAPENSANTDGIHIGRSDGVTISDTIIQTGDDCISVGDGTKQLAITGVRCGPGHGISVGSLGKFQNEEDVVGITVKNCTLSKTMFGVRIKTWPASPPGIASDMHFEDITMDQVGNPVLIDQEYCPWNQCKDKAPSKVKVSKVSFKNIRGTSATQNVVKLACSSSNPCVDVEVGDISVTYNGKEGPANSVCTNVKPKVSGKIPVGCA